jgi:hypothetical protein
MLSVVLQVELMSPFGTYNSRFRRRTILSHDTFQSVITYCQRGLEASSLRLI